MLYVITQDFRSLRVPGPPEMTEHLIYMTTDKEQSFQRAESFRGGAVVRIRAVELPADISMTNLTSIYKAPIIWSNLIKNGIYI